MNRLQNMDIYKWFIAPIVKFILKISKKECKIEKETKKSSQYSLTPSIIEPYKEDKKTPNKAYQPVKDIADKLLDKDVKNIALTGPYGSGKSSVLLTLKEHNKQYNYLNISLATLECDYKDEEKSETSKQSTDEEHKEIKKDTKEPQVKIKGFLSEGQKEEALNRIIEYSILQQLIYKEKTCTIPQSRLKRIKHISNCESCRISIGLALFIIACLILLEPSFLRIETFYTLFSCTSDWKNVWDILSALYIIFAFVYSVKRFIIATYNNKINKINLKDGEIDISESTSIFNKHLDEIIYFFEVTTYDVVILEDLDRFKTPCIFLKLRELNQLLNNSKAISRKNGRPIVFIYAVKDDIFKDSSRTKFFDYIATVIPIINPSNSGVKLKKALEEQGVNTISDDVYTDLGIFIDDMRILKNIANEYVQYSEKLDIDKLIPQNLLGMILYKNYEPKDFALLHNQDGIVYKVIKNKVKYHNSAVKEKEDVIKKLEEELKQITNFYSTQKAKELRILYVNKYLEKYDVSQFKSKDGIYYTPKQIIDDNILFEQLEKGELEYKNRDNYYAMRFNRTFQEVENEVDSKYTYRQRLGMTSNRIVELEKEIEQIQQGILEYKTRPLHEILSAYYADDFFQDVEKNHLIAFLLRRGYIDENYYDYISYFYEGIITNSDREFILDAKIGRSKDYYYEINKHENVIKQLPYSVFKEKSTLNIGLVDFIVSIQDKYKQQWILLSNSIKRKKEFEFVEAYYHRGKEKTKFFNTILPLWSKFFTDGVLNINEPKKEKVNFEILLRYFPESKIEQYNNTVFKNYLSDSFNFISSKIGVIGLDNAKLLTYKLDINYSSLFVDGEVNKEWMEYVVSGFHYKSSKENVTIILRYIDTCLADQFIDASYSAILESKCESLIEFIDNNLSYCIKEVFSENSIKENEKSIISLIENTSIEAPLKKEYLSKQIYKIKDIESLNSNFWDIAIECNIIFAWWGNIDEYISNSEGKTISTLIIEFIKTNSKTLSSQNANKIKNSSILFRNLMGTNILPISDYQLIKQSFNYCFDKDDLSELAPERMNALIEGNGIKLNEHNYKLINEHFTDLVPKLVLKNKSIYFANIVLFPLNASSSLALLTNDSLIYSEKLAILKTLPTNIFSENLMLANVICKLWTQSDNLTISNDDVLAILSVSDDNDCKLDLFVKKCLSVLYDETFVKSGLQFLGGEYADIALQKGLRPKLDITNSNKSLAAFLEKNKFISKQLEQKGKIRINSRKI